MDKLNRRAMVRGILCGAAVVGVGLALPPGEAEAMPIDASLADAPDDSAHLELYGGFCAFSTIAFLALASVAG